MVAETSEDQAGSLDRISQISAARDAHHEHAHVHGSRGLKRFPSGHAASQSRRRSYGVVELVDPASRAIRPNLSHGFSRRRPIMAILGSPNRPASLRKED